jgi:hypothetical protein
MRWLLLALVFGGATAGCNNPTYLFQRRPLETQADAMNQGAFTADVDLYVLPVRRPSQDERRALTQERMRLGLPMNVPWVGVRDFDIEIQWSIKNLEPTAVTASFTVSGGNEFGDYDPGQYVDPTVIEEDQVAPPPLLGGTPIELAANEVRSGMFREDDLLEAATDLEAIIRYPAGGDTLATPFQVLVRHSSASRIGLESIPGNDVIPAMVRFALNLAADGHVVLDYNVRVRDHSGKLAAPPATGNLFVSVDADVAPPVAPPASATMP